MLPRLWRRLHAVMHPPTVNVGKLKLGRHVRIEPGVDIDCDRLTLGDGVTIKTGTRIKMTDLTIGDYTTIGENCVLDGTDWCRIGHNCWFGHFTIIDSKGTTRIGNNVGVGAHSQLWTHIYFGDRLFGCRFASHRPLVIDDDVWFVGHCIVSPIHAKAKSMAMVGSVVTRDMEDNRLYAGTPAKDVTETFGPQFEPRTLDVKREMMEGYLAQFRTESGRQARGLRIVDVLGPQEPGITQFSLSERCYTKQLLPEEVQFMRFLLPTRAKFVPTAETDWIAQHLPAPR